MWRAIKSGNWFVELAVFSVFFLLGIVFSLEPEWGIFYHFLNNSVEEVVILFFEVLVTIVSFHYDINQDEHDDRTSQFDFDYTFAESL